MTRSGSGTSGALVGGEACCSPVAGVPLTRDQAKRLARMLKVLAEPSRLRLISTMVSSPGAAACGCELTTLLGLSQPTISHHLAALREAGLVERVAAGGPDDGSHSGPKCTYYGLAPEALAAVAGALTPPSDAPPAHPAT